MCCHVSPTHWPIASKEEKASLPLSLSTLHTYLHDLWQRFFIEFIFTCWYSCSLFSLLIDDLIIHIESTLVVIFLHEFSLYFVLLFMQAQFTVVVERECMGEHTLNTRHPRLENDIDRIYLRILSGSFFIRQVPSSFHFCLFSCSS